VSPATEDEMTASAIFGAMTLGDFHHVVSGQAVGALACPPVSTTWSCAVSRPPRGSEPMTTTRLRYMNDYRLAQVRAELAAHADGVRLTAEFDALATHPAEAPA
jgi:hypothetical protein